MTDKVEQLTRLKRASFMLKAVELETELVEAMGKTITSFWGSTETGVVCTHGGIEQPKYVRDHAATFGLMVEMGIHPSLGSKSIADEDQYAMALVAGKQITEYLRDYPGVKELMAVVVVKAAIEKYKALATKTS